MLKGRNNMKKKWKFIAVLVVVLSLVGSYDAYRYFTYNRYKERNYAIEPRLMNLLQIRQNWLSYMAANRF